MIEVELVIELHTEWVHNVISLYSVNIKIRDIRKSSAGLKSLVEIFAPNENICEVLKELKSIRVLPDSYVHLSGKSRGMAIMETTDCDLCNSISTADIFLVDSHNTDEARMLMTFLVPSEEALSGFLHGLEEKGIAFHLIRKKNLQKKSDLTERQEYVVKTALELGFFEYPKKINLEGLSKRLNVSYVTLSEILRRAEKNIITKYFS